MSLTVEDGTGLAAADAYASVAVADAYHTALGNTAWTGTDAAKEIALRRATQYLDNRYTYRGTRLNGSQALEWPRVGYELGWRVEAWPVPNLRDACCEAALRALTAALQTDVAADQVTEETVGPITVKYALKTGQTRYPVVDSLLARYSVGGAGGSIRVERAS